MLLYFHLLLADFIFSFVSILQMVAVAGTSSRPRSFKRVIICLLFLSITLFSYILIEDTALSMMQSWLSTIELMVSIGFSCSISFENTHTQTHSMGTWCWHVELMHWIHPYWCNHVSNSSLYQQEMILAEVAEPRCSVTKTFWLIGIIWSMAEPQFICLGWL